MGTIVPGGIIISDKIMARVKPTHVPCRESLVEPMFHFFPSRILCGGHILFSVQNLGYPLVLEGLCGRLLVVNSTGWPLSSVGSMDPSSVLSVWGDHRDLAASRNDH